MKVANARVFNLESVSDYLRFCVSSVESFRHEPNNIHLCFSAILALNHIPDWLNEKLLQEERSQLSLPRAKDSNKHSNNVFQQFKSKNQSIDLIRQVANGFKHLSSDMPETTATGWGRGYGLSCGESRFLIEKNIRADVLCEEVLAYWHKILTPILTDRVTIGK